MISQLFRAEKLNGKYWAVHVTIHLMENFHHALVWVLPTVLISILLTTLKVSCKEACLESYQKLLMFQDEMNFSRVIFYGGSFINIFSLLFNLLILTSSMDEAFQDLQDLKRNIIEKLRFSSVNEAQSFELRYFKDRIDLMRPMSASGYFDIDKTTLTSMLSVR